MLFTNTKKISVYSSSKMFKYTQTFTERTKRRWNEWKTRASISNLSIHDPFVIFTAKKKFLFPCSIHYNNVFVCRWDNILLCISICSNNIFISNSMWNIETECEYIVIFCSVFQSMWIICAFRSTTNKHNFTFVFVYYFSFEAFPP